MESKLLDYWREGSHDAFDALFDHAPVLMHSIDAEGRLLRVSRYWAALLGYAPGEMEGRYASDFQSPSSRAHAAAVVLPAVRRDGRVHNLACEFLARDGAVIPVLLSAVAELDSDGRMLRALAVLTDNRAALAAQEALARKAAEAEEASAAKSRFLAAMSHEIRTPMNAILGFAQLLELSPLDEQRRGHVAAILRAGGDLMNLLTDLLDLSQVEAGHMRIESREVDLHALLEEVADWWVSSAREKGLRFVLTEERGLPRMVHTDPVRLQQVLNNFLGNALKFTEEGQIGLAVAHVSRDGDDERLRFEVFDTGPGVTAEEQSRLFKPFVQIESDFGKDRGGWGLGLSICHSIAEAMGGDVGVTSRPGEGSVFHFELPVRVAEEPMSRARRMQDDRRPAEARVEGTGLHILLAEDNALNREVATRILEKDGHAVTVVEDGFAAVKAAHSNRFDLVLMDVMMPGLDGLGAAEQIRMLGGARGRVPIVACSAHVAPEAQARYRAAGMDGFVPKPIDRTVLDAEIARVLGERAAPG